MRIARGWILVLLAAVSCEKPLFETVSRWRLPGRGPGDRAEAPAPAGPVTEEGPAVWITAFRFPEGNDWMADDFRDGELVLFRNGQEVLSLPAAKAPDPERHRVWEGALWTDRSDGKRTTVSRNGVPMFSFDGEERLTGFLILNGDVHTLGQRPGQGGICYRMNGQELYAASGAVSLGSADDREWPGGALSSDGDGVFYSYALPLQKNGQTLWEYKVMRGNAVIGSVPAGQSVAVYDIRYRQGVIYRCEQRNKSITSIGLTRGEVYAPVMVGTLETPRHIRLVPEGDGMLVKGISERSQLGDCLGWFRDQEGMATHYSDSHPIIGLWQENGHQAYITQWDGKVFEVLLDGTLVPLSAGRYLFSTPRCAHFKGGRFAAAFTDPLEGAHLWCLDRHIDSLRFNGYITSITLD